MPEKVRVCPATGPRYPQDPKDQAALLLLDDPLSDEDDPPEDDPPEDELPEDELPEDELPDEDESEEEEEDEEAEDSLLAGTVLVPEERLSVR